MRAAANSRPGIPKARCYALDIECGAVEQPVGNQGGAGVADRFLSGGKMIDLSVVTAERQPYIMGVLPYNREVPVQDVSSGQRPQLYLALRFANLKRHFQHNDRCRWFSTTCSCSWTTSAPARRSRSLPSSRA